MTDDADRLYERLLVLRCQAGDEAAFAELVDHYQPRLRYYLHKMLAGVGDTDDVLQEIWLDVFRSVARLNAAGAFRAWLYRIAHDRAVKVFRKRRPQLEPLQDVVIDDATQDADVFQAEDAERVHGALDTLSAMQREVLVLRYIEDMSYDEIAAIVNCQVGTVRSRLHYAKRALREQLEKERHYER
jgi:RNA polymerase sigma-70 factor (ECF subfamily)